MGGGLMCGRYLAAGKPMMSASPPCQTRRNDLGSGHSRFVPLRKIKIVQVRYFLAVYAVRNFTLAAKACGVSQPSLSASIRRLERQLGGDLFRRARDRRVMVTPTELAMRVRPCFEAVVSNMDAAIQLAIRPRRSLKQYKENCSPRF